MEDSETTDNVQEDTPCNVSWGITEIAIGIFAAIFLGLICIQIYFVFGDRNQTTTLPAILAGLGGGWLAFYGTPVLVSKNLQGGIRQQMGLRFHLPGDIWRGVLVGIGGQALVALVFLPVKAINPKLVEGISGPAKELTNHLSSWRWVVFVLFVAVISPIGEELFFRGLTLRALTKKWGAAAGIIGSALIFGLIHFEKVQTIGLIAFGILLAIRATKTGRIGETIIAHGTFNFITVMALFFGWS